MHTVVQPVSRTFFSLWNWNCTHLTVLNPSVMSNSLWPPWTAATQAPLCMGILQARILEWVAMPSSRGSFQLRDKIRNQEGLLVEGPSENPHKRAWVTQVWTHDPSFSWEAKDVNKPKWGWQQLQERSYVSETREEDIHTRITTLHQCMYSTAEAPHRLIWRLQINFSE